METFDSKEGLEEKAVIVMDMKKNTEIKLINQH